MAEAPPSGKPQAVESDYFVQLFGFDLELTPVQTNLYFTIPDYHRHFLERIVKESDSFQPESLKYYLGMICGEAEPGGFKDVDKLAQRLWADYQDIRQEVTTCMALYRLSRLMFPLTGFDNLQPAFESSIMDMIEQGILPERGDLGLMTVVCLPEVERNLYFMDDIFRGLPAVWRGYLDNEIRPAEKTKSTVTPAKDAKKPSTREQYQEWTNKAVCLAKTGRYNNKLDICRAIKKQLDLDGGVSVTPEHIRDSIKISAKELKDISKKTRV